MSETPLISFSHHFEEYFFVIGGISGIHSSVYYKNATLHKLQNCLLQPVSSLRCAEIRMEAAPWIVLCGCSCRDALVEVQHNVCRGQAHFQHWDSHCAGVSQNQNWIPLGLNHTRSTYLGVFLPLEQTRICGELLQVINENLTEYWLYDTNFQMAAMMYWQQHWQINNTYF